VPLAEGHGFLRESTPLLNHWTSRTSVQGQIQPKNLRLPVGSTPILSRSRTCHRSTGPFQKGHWNTPCGRHRVNNERPIMSSIFPEVDHSYVDQKQSDPTGYLELWLHVTADAVLNLRAFGSRAAEEFIFDEDNEFFDEVARFLGFSPTGLRDAIRKRIRDPQQRRRIGQVERS